jgi:hypothetical protein
MVVFLKSSGLAHGWGKDPWKWVSGLSSEAKAAIAAGHVVFIEDCHPSSNGVSGSTRRQVVYSGNRYVHRVLTADQECEIASGNYTTI